MDNLRAPLFEEKVVDHLLSQITVTDKKVTKEELLAVAEEDFNKPAKNADKAKGEEPKKKEDSKKKAKEANAK